MNAVSEPTCMAPSAIRYPPNHSTATIARLKTSITVGNMAAIHLPVYTATLVRSSLARPNRSVSYDSSTARITRIPVICSRRTG